MRILFIKSIMLGPSGQWASCHHNIERKAISLLPQGAAEHGTCGCHTANENAYEPMAETR